MTMPAIDTLPSGEMDTNAIIRKKEWGVVQFIVDDSKDQGNCSLLTECFGQWKQSINVFRWLEEKNMIQRDPTSIDLFFHKKLVNILMEHGMTLREAFEIDNPRLHKKNIELVNALLSGLQNALDAYHTPISPHRMKELSSRIFNDEAYFTK